jgi:hypothetical protein
VTPPSGQTDTVDIGYAALLAAEDYGILASTQYKGQWPFNFEYANLSHTAQAAYGSERNFTLQNSSPSTGGIVQGQAHGYDSTALFFDVCELGFAVNDVSVQINGMDTLGVSVYDNSGASGNMSIRNSTFTCNIDNVSNRMIIPGTLFFQEAAGPVFIDSNSVIGSPRVGVDVSRTISPYRTTITNNTIEQNTIVTNGYGVSLAGGAQNIEVGFNTITPTNGRGILIDGYDSSTNENIQIHDNYVLVQETYNREYWTGGTGIEARAFELRNNISGGGGPQLNIQVYNNTFIAQTGGANQVTIAYGARLALVNLNGVMNNSGDSFTNNIMKGIVTTTNSNWVAYGFQIGQLDAGIGLTIAHNTFESNDVSLSISGDDGWNVSGVDLVSNYLKKSSDGAARTYTGVLMGYWIGVVSDVRLIDMKLTKGTTFNIVFSGSGTKDVQVCSLFDVATLGGSSGSFLSGATIAVTNSAGTQVGSGTTGSDGQLPGMITTLKDFAQLTPDPTIITKTVYSAFTVTATLNGVTTTDSLNLTGDFTIDPTIPGA